MQKLFFFVKEWLSKNLDAVNLLVETRFHFMDAFVLRNRIFIYYFEENLYRF